VDNWEEVRETLRGTEFHHFLDGWRRPSILCWDNKESGVVVGRRRFFCSQPGVL
jgi:hypothetical protein